MAKLTPTQIGAIVRQQWKNITQDDDVIRTAVAIALAESGGDPAATNKNTNGTTDYGLFQINSVHDGSLWPKGSLKADGSVTINGQKTSLFDPETNAGLAATLYARRGNKFDDWSVYKSGKYKQYLTQVPDSVTAMDFGETVTDNTVGAQDSLASGIADPVSAGFASLSGTLTRIGNSAGLWLVAGVLFVVGVVLVLGKAGGKIAGKVPAVKAAKAVIS